MVKVKVHYDNPHRIFFINLNVSFSFGRSFLNDPDFIHFMTNGQFQKCVKFPENLFQSNKKREIGFYWEFFCSSIIFDIFSSFGKNLKLVCYLSLLYGSLP